MSEVMGPWDKMTPIKALHNGYILYKHQNEWGYMICKGTPFLEEGGNYFGKCTSYDISFPDANLVFAEFNPCNQETSYAYFDVILKDGIFDKYWIKFT